MSWRSLRVVLQQSELEHRDGHDHNEEDVRHRARVAHVEEVEAFLVHVQRHGEGAVVGAALRHHEGFLEDVEEADRGDDGRVEQRRAQERDRDPAQLLEGARAVELRGLAHFLRDRLEARDEQHHDVADVAPHRHRDHGRHREVLVAEEVGRGEPDRVEEPGHEPVARIEHEAPHDGHRDDRGHDGRVETDPEEGPRAVDAVVEQDRDEQPGGDRDGHSDDHEVPRVEQGLQELVVLEEVDVVVEADELRVEGVRHVGEAEVGEAHEERRDDRQRHEDGEEDEERGGEEPARQVVRAHRTAPAGGPGPPAPARGGGGRALRGRRGGRVCRAAHDRLPQEAFDLGLGLVQGRLGARLALGDLLDRVVDLRGDLRPLRERGRGLRVLDLRAEGLEVLVGRELAAVPGGGAGREVAARLVELGLALGARQVLHEVRGGGLVVAVLGDDERGAAGHRGRGLVARHRRDAPLALEVRVRLVDRADLPGAGEEHRHGAAVEVLEHVVAGRDALLREALAEVRAVLRERADRLGAVDDGLLAVVADDLAARRVQEGVEALHRVGAGGLDREAPPRTGLLLVRGGEGLHVLPRLGRLGDPGLLGEVRAVVDDARVDVPRHAVRRVVHDALLPGGREEVLLVEGLRVDRLQDAQLGELAHVAPAHLRDVGELARGGGGDELLVRDVPADRSHLDGDVRVRLLVGLGDVGELLALGAHAPDREGLLLVGGDAPAAGAAAGGDDDHGGDRGSGDRGVPHGLPGAESRGAVHDVLLLERVPHRCERRECMRCL
ncbi:putative bacterial extracellular solute-binding protein [Streptomyces sp. Tu6071]|nr:putative bacterial extracellular solute-binding protein [Streptomyces sp. Tu6071]